MRRSVLPPLKSSSNGTAPSAVKKRTSQSLSASLCGAVSQKSPSPVESHSDEDDTLKLSDLEDEETMHALAMSGPIFSDDEETFMECTDESIRPLYSDLSRGESAYTLNNATPFPEELEPLITLHVETLTGTLHSMDAFASDTVLDIKTQLHYDTGVTLASIQLIYAGKLLDRDYSILRDLQIGDGANLKMVVKMSVGTAPVLVPALKSLQEATTSSSTMQMAEELANVLGLQGTGTEASHSVPSVVLFLCRQDESFYVVELSMQQRELQEQDENERKETLEMQPESVQERPPRILSAVPLQPFERPAQEAAAVQGLETPLLALKSHQNAPRTFSAPTQTVKKDASTSRTICSANEAVRRRSSETLLPEQTAAKGAATPLALMSQDRREAREAVERARANAAARATNASKPVIQQHAPLPALHSTLPELSNRGLNVKSNKRPLAPLQAPSPPVPLARSPRVTRSLPSIIAPPTRPYPAMLPPITTHKSNMKPSTPAPVSIKAPSLPPITNHCFHCSSRLGLARRFQCRCGGTFCSRHRFEDQHHCNFDFKSTGRHILAIENPRVGPRKIEMI